MTFNTRIEQIAQYFVNRYPTMTIEVAREAAREELAKVLEISIQVKEQVGTWSSFVMFSDEQIAAVTKERSIA